MNKFHIFHHDTSRTKMLPWLLATHGETQNFQPVHGKRWLWAESFKKKHWMRGTDGLVFGSFLDLLRMQNHLVLGGLSCYAHWNTPFPPTWNSVVRPITVTGNHHKRHLLVLVADHLVLNAWYSFSWRNTSFSFVFHTNMHFCQLI